MAYVVATTGPANGQKYELSRDSNVLGRNPDCEIMLDVGAVSRRHARIVRDGPNYFVEDLRSRNGTYLNDRAVQDRHILSDGDCVRICDVVLMFRGDVAPVAQPVREFYDEGETGSKAVLVDDHAQPASSRIVNTMDVSVVTGSVQYSASAEAKLAALVEITQCFRGSMTLDDVLPRVLDSLFKIFLQADRGFIVLRKADGQLVPTWSKVRRSVGDDEVQISRTIVRQVMDSQEAVLSTDAVNDSRFDMSQSMAAAQIRSMMCAPLIDSNNESIGVLQIDTMDQRKQFQDSDLEVLASVAIQAGIAIDNAKMHEHALAQRELQRDLELAQQVQKAFLPSEPPGIADYEFYDYYKPAIHVGGDYFDYVPLRDGRHAAVIADVVGHGVAAAMLMAKLAAEVRYCLAGEVRPSDAVKNVNDRISRLKIDKFITFVLIVLDPQRHEVTTVNAGHMTPMLLRADGTVDEPGEDVVGLPVGITDEIDYDQFTFSISPGEMLIMFTDGINEAMNRLGECYGVDRIRRHLRTTGGTPATVGETIVDDVLHFIDSDTQDDDMCLVCFRRVR